MQPFDYFSDPAFKEAMNELCTDQEEETIDPANVTALNIQNPDSLSDIKYFGNLQSLYLSGGDLDNLEEIKVLKHLTELSLFDIQITDLSAIWKMNQLTSFYMDECSDISSVARLRNLKRLTIVFGDLSSSSPLKQLTMLEELTLQSCNLSSLDFISNMMLLRSINIGMNSVRDIKPLERLVNLETVEIWDNKISDLSPLKHLKRIKTLDISNNPICWSCCDLNDLSGLPFVNKLGLYGIPINAEQIRKAQEVRQFYIGGKEYNNIAFLINHQNIEKISLCKSTVRDISCFIKLPKLKSLWLEGNECIKDYSPIYQLRSSGVEVNMDGWEIDNDYVELHVHTYYTKSSSVISPRELADRLSDVDAKAAAITDFNTVAAFPEAEFCFKQKNINIIFGMETRTEKGLITLLVKNQSGLKNIYGLVSDLGDTQDTINKERLLALREGLLLGSGGEYGELARAIAEGAEWKGLKSLAAVFNYLEVTPVFPEDTVKTIIRLGKELNIPVCAVSDARFLEREDELLLRILNDTSFEAPSYLRDNQSKRSAFSYLDRDTQNMIISEGPQEILKRIEDVKLFPHDTFLNDTEKARAYVKKAIADGLERIYSNKRLPQIVQERVEAEQNAIISRRYAASFMAAKLCADTVRGHGYSVISRGIIGSSYVAFLMGITDVNPLPPHQFCPRCGCFIFWPGVASGFDYRDDLCVFCKIPRVLDGHDIPIEMFLGNEGDPQIPVIEISVPDKIRKEIYTVLEKAFGKGNVLRASVIHTLAHAENNIPKKVWQYFVNSHIQLSDTDVKIIAERLSRIRGGLIGFFAGIYIVPQNADEECVIPIINSDVQPFAAFPEPYLSQHLPCLKMPSLYETDLFKTLHRITGIRYDDVPLKKESISLFSSAEKLGIPTKSLLNGAAGISEFSSAYVQGIIRTVSPKAFSDYTKVCALYHGSGVWQGNQDALLSQGILALDEVIATSEDVYQLLIDMNINEKQAYSITEFVRKGKLKQCSKHDAMINELYHAGLPETQVKVLTKIRYLLPKAHAVSYTIMAAKMAWYKLYYPAEFYEAYYKSNLLPDDLTNGIFQGPEYIQKRIEEIDAKNHCPDHIEEQQKKETYQVAYEMLLRGYYMNEAGKVIAR